MTVCQFNMRVCEDAHTSASSLAAYAVVLTEILTGSRYRSSNRVTPSNASFSAGKGKAETLHPASFAHADAPSDPVR